jgi:hypothetical protein
VVVIRLIRVVVVEGEEVVSNTLCFFDGCLFLDCFCRDFLDVWSD